MNKTLLTGFILLFCEKSFAAYLPCTTEEINAQTCFSCGDKCSIRYSSVILEDGTIDEILTVSGEGEMKKYHPDPIPWRQYKTSVTKVIIEEGITSIGYDAFWISPKLKDVKLPNSLESLEPGSFQNCPLLEKLIIPDGVYIKDASLEGSLTSVVIPAGATLASGAFKYAYQDLKPLERIYCMTEQMQACTKAAEPFGIAPTIYSKDSEGHAYIYDSKGQIIGKYSSVLTLSQGKATETYKYDSAGHLVGIFDGNGQRTWGKKNLHH